MIPNSRWRGVVSLLLLRNSRSILAGRRIHATAAGVGALYALIAMYFGSMLVLSYPPFQVESYIALVVGGSPWWNYPAVLVETPHFVLALPFLSTVVMVLVSAGVGFGMTVAGLLVRSLVRAHRARPAGIAGVSAAGLTPALVALVTLGACCSTTAAASAGVVLVAAVTGTSVAFALANSWYLGLFQLAVLGLGLLAQEQLVMIYGRLPELVLRRVEDSAPTETEATPARS
jgi:hypothetical protein